MTDVVVPEVLASAGTFLQTWRLVWLSHVLVCVSWLQYTFFDACCGLGVLLRCLFIACSSSLDYPAHHVVQSWVQCCHHAQFAGALSWSCISNLPVACKYLASSNTVSSLLSKSCSVGSLDLHSLYSSQHLCLYAGQSSRKCWTFSLGWPQAGHQALSVCLKHSR